MRILVDTTIHGAIVNRQRLIARARQAAIAAETSGCETLAAHYFNLATQGEAVLAHETTLAKEVH